MSQGSPRLLKSLRQFTSAGKWNEGFPNDLFDCYKLLWNLCRVLGRTYERISLYTCMSGNRRNATTHALMLYTVMLHSWLSDEYATS